MRHRKNGKYQNPKNRLVYLFRRVLDTQLAVVTSLDLTLLSVDIKTVYIGIQKLKIVDITLDRFEDNPQLVFESLNSTGLRLSSADLTGEVSWGKHPSKIPRPLTADGNRPPTANNWGNIQ